MTPEQKTKILEASPHLDRCGALLEELAPDADRLLIRAAAVAYAAAVLAAFDCKAGAMMLAEASQAIAGLTAPAKA